MYVHMLCDLRDRSSTERAKKCIDSFEPLIRKNYISNIYSIQKLDSIIDSHYELYRHFLFVRSTDFISEDNAYLLPNQVDNMMRIIDTLVEKDPPCIRLCDGGLTFYRPNLDICKTLAAREIQESPFDYLKLHSTSIETFPIVTQ